MKINRNRGEFYTPPHIASIAHEYISKPVSPEWKERFLVWDNCCGKGNLTIGYNIKNLIATTLEYYDIEYIKSLRSLPNNYIVGQLDFLNDEIPCEIINKIKSNTSLLFLMNPPFVYSGRSPFFSAKRSVGNVTCSRVQESMRLSSIKFGHAQKQLITQFIFRCVEIAEQFNVNNYYICTFGRLKILSSESFNNFNNWLFKRMQIVGGFIFNSLEFSGCKSAWPVMFIILKSSKQIAKSVTLNILHTNKLKTIHLLNNKSSTIKNYISLNNKPKQQVETYTMSSWLNIRNKQKLYITKTNQKLICFAAFKANNVVHALTETILTSLPYSHKATKKFSVTEENFNNIIAYTGVRLLLPQSWIYQHDDYKLPEKDILQSKEFEIWSANLLPYVLFSSANHCIALYHKDAGRIENNLYWMSGKQKRYVYRVLEKYQNNGILYHESKSVLSLAQELTLRVDKEREKAGLPWDAGYRQLKELWIKYENRLYKNFKQAYKALEEKLKPGVFKFGWLEKPKESE